MGHVRNYRRGELEEKLRSTGFVVERAIYWGFPFYSPLARTVQNHTSVGSGDYGALASLAAKAMHGALQWSLQRT